MQWRWHGNRMRSNCHARATCVHVFAGAFAVSVPCHVRVLLCARTLYGHGEHTPTPGMGFADHNRSRTHTPTHSRTHTHTREQVHTHTHAHTHAHTRTLPTILGSTNATGLHLPTLYLLLWAPTKFPNSLSTKGQAAGRKKQAEAKTITMGF